MADEAPQWPPNDCSLINSGDTAWMLTSCALVLLMTPGLAFFYGGLVNRTSVLTIIMQCFISMGLTSVIWVVIGFSLAFGEDGGNFLGNPATYPMLTNMDGCTPTGYPMTSATGTMPGILFCGYQMMFAIISPALITGAFADRVKFKAYLVFISFWILIVYCPFVHWVWSPKGFLAIWGVKDFAGGIVVHISAGFAALASVFVVGSRKYTSEEERHRMQVPHNRTFVALGTGLLWVGWFGFNGGSALASNTQASYALINTSIAASSAMCMWMLIDWIKLGKPTLVGVCIGAIAGLATITPASGFVRPWAACLIGAVTAILCYGCIVMRDLFKWDDALDVWGCHGMGGFFGSLMLGFLADKDIGGVERSGMFFGKQLAACCGTAVYSFVVSYLLLKIIGLFMDVVPDQNEIAMGLDVSLHGEQAYDDEVLNDVSKSNPKAWDDLPYVPSQHVPSAHPVQAKAVPPATYQGNGTQQNGYQPSAYAPPPAPSQQTYPGSNQYPPQAPVQYPQPQFLPNGVQGVNVMQVVPLNQQHMVMMSNGA